MRTQALTPADQEFLSSLFERHKGVMYKTALDMGVRDAEMKNAVVHEALIRLPDKLDTLRGLGEKGRAAYVSSIVRYVIMEWSRRRHTHMRYVVDADISELLNTAPGVGFEEDYLERETRRGRLNLMWEAMAEISDADRRILIGKYIDGKSDYALAAELHITEASLRKKLTLAKRRVRKIIQGKEGEAQ